MKEAKRGFPLISRRRFLGLSAVGLAIAVLKDEWPVSANRSEQNLVSEYNLDAFETTNTASIALVDSLTHGQRLVIGDLAADKIESRFKPRHHGKVASIADLRNWVVAGDNVATISYRGVASEVSFNGSPLGVDTTPDSTHSLIAVLRDGSQKLLWVPMATREAAELTVSGMPANSQIINATRLYQEGAAYKHSAVLAGFEGFREVTYEPTGATMTGPYGTEAGQPAALIQPKPNEVWAVNNAISPTLFIFKDKSLSHEVSLNPVFYSTMPGSKKIRGMAYDQTSSTGFMGVYSNLGGELFLDAGETFDTTDPENISKRKKITNNGLPPNGVLRSYDSVQTNDKKYLYAGVNSGIYRLDVTNGVSPADGWHVLPFTVIQYNFLANIQTT